METLTDEELMALAGEGDDSAFSVLVQRHQTRVFGTAAKMLGSLSEAEDVAQQVFIRVYRAAPRYKPTAKFTTWLMTICRNCVFTHSKKLSRQRTEPLEYTDEEESGGGESRYADPEAYDSSRQLLVDELEQQVNTAILELPETQRMALVLRQYEQMDYDEIARVMGVSLSSVKSLLFRARDTLREKLRHYLEQ